MTRRCGRWESVVTGLSSSEPLPASSLALSPQMRRASARPRRIIRAPEPIHAPRARTCGLYPRRRSRFPVDSLSRDVDGSRDPAASDPRRARAGPGQPRVIGLGDRAYKRGVRYDSSVSDLEWHRVIRIPSGWRAPDRPAGSVAHMWDRPVQRDASGGRCDVSGWRRIHHHACGETCRRGSCAAIRVAASEERCGPRPVCEWDERDGDRPQGRRHPSHRRRPTPYCRQRVLEPWETHLARRWEEGRRTAMALVAGAFRSAFCVLRCPGTALLRAVAPNTGRRARRHERSPMAHCAAVVSIVAMTVRYLVTATQSWRSARAARRRTDHSVPVGILPVDHRRKCRTPSSLNRHPHRCVLSDHARCSTRLRCRTVPCDRLAGGATAYCRQFVGA